MLSAIRDVIHQCRRSGLLQDEDGGIVLSVKGGLEGKRKKSILGGSLALALPPPLRVGERRRRGNAWAIDSPCSLTLQPRG